MKLNTATKLLVGALVTGAAHGLDLYVSLVGNDAGSGSTTEPFKTLGQAQRAVRKQLEGSVTEDINIHVSPGVHILPTPLVLTASDSGKNGFKVNWIGDDTVLSGGLRVTGWSQGTNGIYTASVPVGTASRNLYVNGAASNYARRKINRKDFSYVNTGMTWTNAANDWLQTAEGLAGAEVRFISSFTDRYAQIKSVGNRQLVMVQTAWQDQLRGYDTISKPNAEFGVWVQNAPSLFTDGGQFYLDSKAGKVHYKPLAGENMSTAETYLGILEAIVVVGGTYDSPAHDITFRGLSFAHTTWMKPSQGYGYVDQQTGGYIGENKTYANFESARPYWLQMPSAIQISAAQRISFTGGNYTQLGAGGFGIGNDPNAHASKVGLGASDVSVTHGYFTQVMGNSITAGGIRADAHHPSDPRMVNTRITIANNIFFNNSALFSSTVPIFASYFQYSNISHNDIFVTPYSGLCVGYGWGANDAGGSKEYENRGLYNGISPRYTTPTTFRDIVVEGNLIHRFGFSHTDLGGIYTLSKSPSSRITGNYVYDSQYFGLYNDEGSNSFVITNNIFQTRGAWNVVNTNGGIGTAGNLTNTGNWAPGAGGANRAASSVAQTGTAGMRVAYRAGVEPRFRAGRPVSNDPALKDANLDIVKTDGQVSVQLSNFDDGALEGVVFSVTAASGGSLTPGAAPPTTVPANGAAAATFKYSGARPSIQATVKYTNQRTEKTTTLTASG